MSIAVITENFLIPWEPNELEKFLGGCQECTVLLSEALVRINKKVSVFLHGPTPSKDYERNGVLYSDFSKFDLYDNYDTIILFKINPLKDDERLKKTNVIYWSSDIENRPVAEYIDHFVCLTEFHKETNDWKDALVIPHGIDMESLEKNRVPKRKNTMLYCSSYDRGLGLLFQFWEQIKKEFTDLELYVTYGFEITKKICGENEDVVIGEEKTKEFCENLNINYLGNLSRDELEKLYWECEYWVHPLTYANAELFCLNAIKSKYCECKPVVCKIGALTETVGDYIDFCNFINGRERMTKVDNVPPMYSWDEVVDKWWKGIV